MVSNLLGNAIRHGTKAPIAVTSRATTSACRSDVHNEGVIAEDVRDHIFDPFRSTAARRARGEGLGLGLYIVQQIVVAHHGSLEVAMSTEAGTTFHVILPGQPARNPGT